MNDAPARSALDELDALLAAGSQGRWFWNTYSAISSSERARIFNDAEGKLTDESPDEDWEALPEFWVATVPVAAGDTATRQGEADAALIVALHNTAPAMVAAIRAAYALAEEAEADSAPAYPPMWASDLRAALDEALGVTA